MTITGFATTFVRTTIVFDHVVSNDDFREIKFSLTTVNPIPMDGFFDMSLDGLTTCFESFESDDEVEIKMYVCESTEVCVEYTRATFTI